MPSLRVFLADDDERARRVITALLGFHAGWSLCGQACDGQEAVDRVARVKPDIIVLDGEMPVLNGFEAARRIVERDPASRIILLTSSNADQTVLRAFHAGAMGFVLKGSATHDLAPAIEAIQRGKTYFTPRFADMILRNCLQGDAVSNELNDRERETVRLLAEELSLTLRHEWRRPRIAEQSVKYMMFAVLAVATAGVWWYELSGEPEHAPPMVENLLVKLGIRAEPMPLTGGNPDAKVWVDVHTGLYYCPGTGYFGRTSRGKYATQRTAQLDHFEPASGKVCE